MNHELAIRLREQRNFEEWVLQDTSLDAKFLSGYRDDNGLIVYEVVDCFNKWSGWLAARTGQKAWEGCNENQS